MALIMEYKPFVGVSSADTGVEAVIGLIDYHACEGKAVVDCWVCIIQNWKEICSSGQVGH